MDAELVEAVDMVCDAEALGDLLARPVVATRLRIKPQVSVSAALADACTLEPWGWVQVLWPAPGRRDAGVEPRRLRWAFGGGP